MKNKNIELKDITSSPYFVAVMMVLLIGLCVAALVFFVMDIQQTKTEIQDARLLYEENVKEFAVLEELKAKSEAAEKQLEECKGILPDSLGDVYLLQENVVAKCKNFGLTVSTIDYVVTTNETQEVAFTINATGSFSNIYNYMNYYSNLEQQHRFDSIVLNKDASTGNYNTVFTLVILSEQGVEGAAVLSEEVVA